MDVKCPNCAVEYEFDDSKVTAAGVTVKCTSCEHVFKVRAADAMAAPAPMAGSMPLNEVSTEWMVKQADGRTFRFKELTTLQKWIVEQKVERDDVISKTGRSWKKLGEIAELASFFQVVDAARAAQRMADTGVLSQPVPAAPGPSAPPAAPAPPVAQPAPPAAAPAGVSASGEFFAGDVNELDSLHDLGDLDDDDPVLQWKRRRWGRNTAIALVFAVAGGGGVAYAVAPEKVSEFLAQVPGLTKAPPPDLGPTVRPALLADTPSDIEPLIAKLEATPELTTSHHAALSRLYTALARAALERGRLEEDAGAKQQADADRAEAMQKAYSHAVAALSSGGDNTDAYLANADYQALKGARAEMSADLDNAIRHAKERAPDVEREASMIRALQLAPAVFALPADQRGGLLEELKTELAKLDEARGSDARVGYLALAIKAEGADVDGTALVAETKAFVDAHPEHERGRGLLKKLEKAAAEAAPEAGNDDNGDGKEGEVKDAPEAKLDYATVLRRAKRAKRAEKTRRAHRLYKKASQLKPGASAPWVGLGWTNLDLDRTSASVTAFKKAIAINPNLAEAQLGLGEAYRALGNKAGAIRAYEAYLAIDPGGVEAPVARNALERLKE